MKTKISVLWPWYQYENWSLGVFLQVPTANQKSRLIFHHKMLLLSTCFSHFITNKSVLSTFHCSITIFTSHLKKYIRLVLGKAIKFWDPLGAIFLIKFLFGNRYFQMWPVDVANSQFSVPPKNCFFTPKFDFEKEPNLLFRRNFWLFDETPISKWYFWPNLCSLVGIDSHVWTFTEHQSRRKWKFLADCVSDGTCFPAIFHLFGVFGSSFVAYHHVLFS